MTYKPNNIKEKVEICSLTVKIVRLELTVECCGNEKKRQQRAVAASK